jgi:hypothetical protein
MFQTVKLFAINNIINLLKLNVLCEHKTDMGKSNRKQILSTHAHTSATKQGKNGALPELLPDKGVSTCGLYLFTKLYIGVTDMLMQLLNYLQ